MRIKLLLYGGICCALFLTSCKTQNRISYFQDLEKETGFIHADTINYEAAIAPDDQLSITVAGIDPSAVALFNLPLTSIQEPGTSAVSTTPVLRTYLVDADGYIDYPVLGRIKVTGMTRRQLTEYLKDRISSYVKSPIVDVQIMNFKVSVLGEVNKPGTITISSERMSVMDAIGLAGDLTIYGERKNVLLIRDIEGKKEYHRFDLTSAATLDSPYYYLKQNDIIYIEPNKARQGNAKYSQNGQFNVSLASTLISAISVIASLAIALFVK